MKKTLLYGLSAVLTLTTILGSLPVHAAIDAKINFETGIPKAFVAGDNSTLTPSTKHFKDGQQSMLWSWTAPSTLQYNDFGQLMRSFRVKKAGIMLWIYNPGPSMPICTSPSKPRRAKPPITLIFTSISPDGAPAGSSTATCPATTPRSRSRAW